MYRVVPVACAFAALAMSSATPAVAQEPAPDAFCASFHTISDEANRVRGDRVDPLTVFLGVEVRCEEKLVEYGQAILKPNSRLRDGWRERLEKNWSAAYCKPGSQSSDAIRNGWKIASIVRTADGHEFRIEATCHEALAEVGASKNG